MENMSFRLYECLFFTTTERISIDFVLQYTKKCQLTNLNSLRITTRHVVKM
jgi:hypothetical protein